MAEHLEVNVSLINQKVQFSGVARSNPEVIFDYNPPLGDGMGYTGLEMLLMSLAACSGTTVISLLRRMRNNILGCRVIAKGTRREHPPMSLSKINLEFIINSNDANENDIIKALQLSEESYCPVWQMLKNNVEIITEYKIIT
jgi:putative redox protein